MQRFAARLIICKDLFQYTEQRKWEGRERDTAREEIIGAEEIT